METFIGKLFIGTFMFCASLILNYIAFLITYFSLMITLGCFVSEGLIFVLSCLEFIALQLYSTIAIAQYVMTGSFET
jgi:hypothetical protein